MTYRSMSHCYAWDLAEEGVSGDGHDDLRALKPQHHHAGRRLSCRQVPASTWKIAARSTFPRTAPPISHRTRPATGEIKPVENRSAWRSEDVLEAAANVPGTVDVNAWMVLTLHNSRSVRPTRKPVRAATPSATATSTASAPPKPAVRAYAVALCRRCHPRATRSTACHSKLRVPALRSTATITSSAWCARTAGSTTCFGLCFCDSLSCARRLRGRGHRR